MNGKFLLFEQNVCITFVWEFLFLPEFLFFFKKETVVNCNNTRTLSQFVITQPVVNCATLLYFVINILFQYQPISCISTVIQSILPRFTYLIMWTGQLRLEMLHLIRSSSVVAVVVVFFYVISASNTVMKILSKAPSSFVLSTSFG